MDYDMLKMVGIMIIVCYIIYLAYGSIKIHADFTEGLTNKNSDNIGNSGIAGNATDYATNIKNLSTQLQDQILLSKYRDGYENTILNLDEYLNLLMLKTVLNINTTGTNNDDISQFNKLNTLNTAKDALNNVMNYIDSN